jgi:Ca2+/Na+ antiporter
VSTIALGACIWIGASSRRQGTIVLQPAVRRQCLVLLASTIVPVMVALLGFNVVTGVLGVLFYLAFLVFSLTRPEEDDDGSSKKTDDVSLPGSGDPDADPPHPAEFAHDGEPASLAYGCGLLLLGAVLIVFCSTPFIDAVTALAERFEINSVLLAFFLAPIASEMPEILESISLSRHGRTNSINIAFSNLIGGTITKTTLLCSVFCFFGVQRGFAWESPSYTISLALLVFSAATAAIIGAYDHRPNKWHGVVLWVLFLFAGGTQYAINGRVVIDESALATAGASI